MNDILRSVIEAKYMKANMIYMLPVNWPFVSFAPHLPLECSLAPMFSQAVMAHRPSAIWALEKSNLTGFCPSISVLSFDSCSPSLLIFNGIARSIIIIV